MGKSSSDSHKAKFVVFLGMLGCGAIAFILGFVFLVVFCISQLCSDLYTVGPGGQSSCNITNGDYPNGVVEVEIVNSTVAGARLQTLVFTKEPQRVYVEETFTYHLEDKSSRYRYYYIPSVRGTQYTISIDASSDVDIKYQYKSGKHTYNLYKASNVDDFTGVFTTHRNEARAYFLIYGSSSTKGTFKVTAKWPRWSWGPGDYAYSCESYPCTFDLSDPKLVDHDLWVVTQNNGVGVWEVYTDANHDKSVWVPVVVVLMVGGFLIAIASCALGLVFAR